MAGFELSAPRGVGKNDSVLAIRAKGDNTAAVIFVNEVDGERFREIDQIGGGRYAAAILFSRRPFVS
jgi:hypothetical protein